MRCKVSNIRALNVRLCKIECVLAQCSSHLLHLDHIQETLLWANVQLCGLNQTIYVYQDCQSLPSAFYVVMLFQDNQLIENASWKSLHKFGGSTDVSVELPDVVSVGEDGSIFVLRIDNKAPLRTFGELMSAIKSIKMTQLARYPPTFMDCTI